MKLINSNNIVNLKHIELSKIFKENVKKNKNILDVLVLKKLQKAIELVFKDKEIVDFITVTTEKNIEKSTATFGNSKITISNMGYLNLENTQDPLLEKLLEIEETVAELLKQRKEYHKNNLRSFESINKVENIRKIGITPYTVSFDYMPKFEIEEISGEIQTQPPVILNKEVLKFTV